MVDLTLNPPENRVPERKRGKSSDGLTDLGSKRQRRYATEDGIRSGLVDRPPEIAKRWDPLANRRVCVNELPRCFLLERKFHCLVALYRVGSGMPSSAKPRF